MTQEAVKTVPFERSSEAEDKGEYFVLSEEDRLRLEAMFTEMSTAEGELRVDNRRGEGGFVQWGNDIIVHVWF